MSEGGRRYRVLGVLGRGGFGTVFRADLIGEGSFVRPVALKVLNPAMEGVHSVAARLRDEARLLGRIRHRAIVQVDGLVRLDDRWTVVMEYVDGVDLGRLIEHGPVQERSALEIAGEVAGALHVAFTWPGPDGRPLGLLHRNLKPANLLLTAAGEVKVLDFGGARTDLDDREAHTRGMRFGSPGYVAPERIDDDERAEGDVYSLGVVLYELLSGRSFGKPSVREERHAAHLEEVLVHLPPVDPETGTLLRRMLAWEPEGRPSAREVERACRSLAARLPGAFLRDWAEGAVPPLLASRTLGDAGSEFSSEFVTERVSMPISSSTPRPAPGRLDPLRTFDGLELDDVGPPEVPGAVTTDGLLRPPSDLFRPPVSAPPPARPPVEVAPPPPPQKAPPEPTPAPPVPVATPAIAPAPRRRHPSRASDVGMFLTVAFVATGAFVVAFTLLCFGWAFLQAFLLALAPPGIYSDRRAGVSPRPPPRWTGDTEVPCAVPCSSCWHSFPPRARCRRPPPPPRRRPLAARRCSARSASEERTTRSRRASRAVARAADERAAWGSAQPSAPPPPPVATPSMPTPDATAVVARASGTSGSKKASAPKPAKQQAPALAMEDAPDDLAGGDMGRSFEASLDADDSTRATSSLAAEKSKDAAELKTEREEGGEVRYDQADHDEEPNRGPVLDWGATVYLSNDDSMSLASAQRVLYSVMNGIGFSTREVRPHELLNYFSFDTVTPDADQLFDVLASATQDGDQLSVALAVKGATPPKQPLDLTLVVDRSCSMSDGGRMDYTQRGLTLMTDQLTEGDRIDVVLFDDTVCTPLQNFVVGRDDPELLKKTIRLMAPLGGTDVGLGLNEGYRVAKAHLDTHGRNRRMMIVTDALVNTGDVDPNTISEIGKAYESDGIRLTGVGVGRDFNDQVLDMLTEKGKGAYVFLGSEAVVDRVFGPTGFRSLTETIAHDVRFALKLPDSLAMERFYGEEASTVKEDVQPINYYAGTTQVFLQDLAIRDGRPVASDAVELEIEYRDALTGEPSKRTFRTTVGKMLGTDPHNVQKGLALMAWTDLLTVQSMGADPCGQELRTYAERASTLADDAEIGFVNGLVRSRCGAFELPSVVSNQGVPFKVRVDADIPISTVALSCGRDRSTESLSGSDVIAMFTAAPGVCELTLSGTVDMTAKVEVPSTGGDLRCTVRGGRLSCS